MLTRSGRILLVDDEASLPLLAARLQDDGYFCHATENTLEALELLQASPFDLLISDITVDGNTRLQLIEEAQDRAPGMPAIIVSAALSVDPAVVRKAIELPVVAYLPEPIEHDVLRSHVATALRRSRQHRILSEIQQQLQETIAELEDVKQYRWSDSDVPNPGQDPAPVPVARQLMSFAWDLLNLRASSDRAPKWRSVCEAIGCPQGERYRKILGQVVEVLHQTKQRFKSKELMDLRAHLERFLEH